MSNTELIMLMYPKCRREAEAAFMEFQGRTNLQQSSLTDLISSGVAVADRGAAKIKANASNNYNTSGIFYLFIYQN